MRSERDLLFEIEAAKAGGDRSAEGRLLLELAHTIPLFTVNLERIGWTLMSAREILGEESEESCMRRMAEVFFSAGNFSQLREAIEEIEKGKSNLRAGHYEIVRARFRLRDNGIDAAIGELGQLGEYRGGDPSFDAHLDIATAEARIAGFEFNAALESAARAVETLENRESGSPALLFNALFIKSIALLLKGDYTAAGKAGAGAVKTAGEHESAFEMYVSGALHGIILLSLSRNDEAKSVLERAFECSLPVSPADSLSYLFPEVFFNLTGKGSLPELYESVISSLGVCVESCYYAPAIVLSLFACLISAWHGDFRLWHDVNRSIDEFITATAGSGNTEALKKNMLALKKTCSAASFKKIREGYEKQPL